MKDARNAVKGFNMVSQTTCLTSSWKGPCVYVTRLLSVASGALGRKVLRALCEPVQPDKRHGYCSRWSTLLYAVICDISVHPLPCPLPPTQPSRPCPTPSVVTPL